MKNDDTVRARRAILAALVAEHGQTKIARRAGRVDRQIGDLIAGRASFGDRLARDLEPLLRPDLPPGWLVFATPDQAPPPADHGNADAELQALAHEIGQELATQANEVAGLWIGLEKDEREEILRSIREKAGKAGDETPLKTLKRRPRKRPDSGTGTDGAS